MRNELIGPAVCANQRGLPSKKVGDAILFEAGPLQLVAGAGGVVARRHVVPVVYVLSPIVQEPRFVERVGRTKLLLQPLDKFAKDLRVRSSIG